MQAAAPCMQDIVGCVQVMAICLGDKAGWMRTVTSLGDAAPERVVSVSEELGFDAELASIVDEGVHKVMEVGIEQIIFVPDSLHWIALCYLA